MATDTTITCGVGRKACETLDQYENCDGNNADFIGIEPMRMFIASTPEDPNALKFLPPNTPLSPNRRNPNEDEVWTAITDGWVEGQGLRYVCKSTDWSQKDGYRFFAAKQLVDRKLSWLRTNDHSRVKHGDNIDRNPFTLSRREAEAIVAGLELDESDMPCKPGACVKEDANGFVRDGQYYFTKDPERLEDMIAKLADKNVAIDGLVDARREELLQHLLAVQKKAMVGREIAAAQLDSLKGQKLIPWFFGISTIAGIGGVIFSALMYKIFKKQSNDQAETDGRKVTVEDLTVDRTKQLKEELAGGKGEFKTPYRDIGLLDAVFEKFRDTNPKYKNYALIGWTDSGKSFFVEQGLPQAIAVEEFLLDHPEKAADLVSRGYPRVPEQHRAWLQGILKKGRELGRPGFMELTIDMGELLKLGAVWKGKEDVMIQKIVKSVVERSKLGLYTNIHLDESKRAAAEHRSADNTLTDVSVIEKLKKACEIPYVSVSQGTTPGEYAYSASDTANSTRYQPVLAPEAPPTEIMARLRTSKALVTELGITTMTDEALKAIVVLARDLKPTTSYNASSAQLMSAVAQYAQFKGRHEITLDLFNEYYAVKHARDMGPHGLTAENLDAHVAGIARVIADRNTNVFRILNEFNNGNVSAELKSELKTLDAVRYSSREELFGKQVCEAAPADVFTGEEQVSRMEAGAKVVVDGTKKVIAVAKPDPVPVVVEEKVETPMMSANERMQLERDILSAFYSMTPREQQRQLGWPGTDFVEIQGRKLPGRWVRQHQESLKRGAFAEGLDKARIIEERRKEKGQEKRGKGEKDKPGIGVEKGVK